MICDRCVLNYRGCLAYRWRMRDIMIAMQTGVCSQFSEGFRGPADVVVAIADSGIEKAMIRAIGRPLFATKGDKIWPINAMAADYSGQPEKVEIVDDFIATGNAMHEAISVVRSLWPGCKIRWTANKEHPGTVQTGNGRPLLGKIEKWQFVTTAHMVDAAVRMANMIDWDFDGVAAVSRSGLIAGCVLATHRHVPLFAIRADGVINCGSGGRLNVIQMPTRILVVDDTVSYGGTLASRIGHVAEYFAGCEIRTAVVYGDPSEAHRICTYVGYDYERPHYLEWCFVNTFWASGLVFDMDGIICDDCTPGTREEDHYEQARPKYLPRMYPAVIVTARPESARKVTIDWLARYGVGVKELIMWPGDPDTRWEKAETVALWKAGIIRERADIRIYAESCPFQAELIAEASGKPVICPDLGHVFNQEKHQWL